MKLLIVDDSLIMRRAVERTLKPSRRFTEIRFATNGRLAIEEYEKFKPDVVTMDITMPDMDGLSAVETIRRDNPDATILVVSALADRSTAVEALKRGARGFLLKPITPESLHTALEEIFESDDET